MVYPAEKGIREGERIVGEGDGGGSEQDLKMNRLKKRYFCKKKKRWNLTHLNVCEVNNFSF